MVNQTTTIDSKFEHNHPSRSRDTEMGRGALCTMQCAVAREHVQVHHTRDSGLITPNGSLSKAAKHMPGFNVHLCSAFVLGLHAAVHKELHHPAKVAVSTST